MSLTKCVAGIFLAYSFPLNAVAQQTMSKSCSNCGKEVPLSTTVGDTCPHCGVLFTGETTTDAGENSKNTSGAGGFAGLFLVGLILAAVLVGGGAYAFALYKMKEQEAQWEKYMESVKQNQPKKKRTKKKRPEADWT